MKWIYDDRYKNIDWPIEGDVAFKWKATSSCSGNITASSYEDLKAQLKQLMIENFGHSSEEVIDIEVEQK